MQCKHLPQDNANVSITYANKKHKRSQKYLSQKSNRREREIERERDRDRDSRYQQDSAEERQTELIYLFGLFTLERERQSVSVSLFFADSSVQECEAEMRNSESKQKRTNFPTGEDLGSGWVRHGQAGFPGSGRKIGQNTLGFKF